MLAQNGEYGAWVYHNPVRITAGPGCRKLLAKALEGYAHVLLLTTSGMVRRGVVPELTGMGCQWSVQEVLSEPTIDFLDATVAAWKQKPVQAIVALGGGSVMDAGKALCLGLRSALERPLRAWLCQGQALPAMAPLPLFVLPTTTGTGAEVTPFATVWDKTELKKYSLSSACLYPGQAFLDPELTLSLPLASTLYSALDAISHALETLWNKHATPMSLLHARHALEILTKVLAEGMETPPSLEQRAQMQYAAFLAGLAISQNRTSIAHAMSYPLTLHFGVPHGLACAVFLRNILALLQENRVFLSRVDSAVLTKIVHILEQQNFAVRLSAFCTQGDITAVRNEMLCSERSTTFLLANPVEYLDQITRL